MFGEVRTSAAFQLFSDKKFRALTDFDLISKEEQDRIFNELVIAGLVIMMMTFEAPDLRMDEEMKQFLLTFKDSIGEGYILALKDLGIERKHLDLWRGLIKMRYEEYSKDKAEIRKAAMEMEDDLTITKLEDIQLLLPLNTVAIGTHNHICRGKTKGKDELFKYILKWLGKFYVHFRVTFEGGKITFWKRVLIKIFRLFHCQY